MKTRVASLDRKSRNHSESPFLIKHGRDSALLVVRPCSYVNRAFANLDVIYTFRGIINRYTVVRENNRTSAPFSPTSSPATALSSKVTRVIVICPSSFSLISLIDCNVSEYSKFRMNQRELEQLTPRWTRHRIAVLLNLDDEFCESQTTHV